MRLFLPPNTHTQHGFFYVLSYYHVHTNLNHAPIPLERARPCQAARDAIDVPAEVSGAWKLPANNKHGSHIVTKYMYI